MPRRLDAQTPKSPFGDIFSRHKEARGEKPAPAVTDNAGAAAATARRPGKSADPAFTKLTSYIRKDTHQAVKIRLLQEGKGREFSEVVQELLEGWLK